MPISSGRNASIFALVAVSAAAVPGMTSAQQVTGAYAAHFQILKIATSTYGQITQMAFGPDDYLYASTADKGVQKFGFSQVSGRIISRAVASPINGLGIAFHGSEMYLSSFDGSIHKLTDNNHNGVWGETSKGELDVAIVTGIPTGDHNVDNLQVSGNTLYVGIGRRTINGRNGAFSSGSMHDYGGSGFWSGGNGYTWGDAAYNGTISYIKDLTQVANTTGSANAYANTTLSRHLVMDDDSPYSIRAVNKLVVHSAGVRNPFGLALDQSGQLYFTNNFNRTPTNANGTSGFGYLRDTFGTSFNQDVYDQAFKAFEGGDYGYADDNWRGKVAMMSPFAPGYHRVRSLTFDNSFNPGPYTAYDPNGHVGLGPSSSPDGCSFWYSSLLPVELQGNMFVARYVGTNSTSDGSQSITYGDIVAIQVSNGTVRRIAYGFDHPLAVLATSQDRLIVATEGYTDGSGDHDRCLYTITVR